MTFDARHRTLFPAGQPRLPLFLVLLALTLTMVSGCGLVASAGPSAKPVRTPAAAKTARPRSAKAKAPQLTSTPAANGSATDAPAGGTDGAATAGVSAGSAGCTPDQPIKADPGTHLYYVPGQHGYTRVPTGMACFASETDALAAGFQHAPK